MYLYRAMLVLVCFLRASLAVAQAEPPAVVTTFIDARPVERGAPRYPPDAARRGQEGWVVLSYVVGTDGRIIEPMIEDSSGIESFERAALDMLRRWTYEPALADGLPVEQSMVKTRVQFVLDGASGAGRPFRRQYQAVLDRMDAGDLAAAEDLLTDLRYTERRNLYEDAWYWWLEYQFLDRRGDGSTPAARDALRKAVGYEEDYLPPDVFVAAAERLYIMDLNAQDVSAAIATYDRLIASKSARDSRYFEPVAESLQRDTERLRALIEGPGILETQGTIGSNSYWVHNLLRRSFSIESIDGDVELVDVRCRRGTIRYGSVAAGNTWTVPDSWGNCGVYIKGTAGTRVRLHEHRPQ